MTEQVYSLDGIIGMTPAGVVANRAPTTLDKVSPDGSPYTPGQSWTNTVTKLNYIYGGNGVWNTLASGTVTTLTTDDSNTAIPSSGNINIFGTAATGPITSSAGSTVTLVNPDATTAQKGVLVTSSNAQSIAGVGTTQAVTPASLAAKLGTQTNHGVLVGAGTAAAITALAVGTNGQVLLGSTGADPVFGTLTSSDSSINFTTGAGTLSLQTTFATEAQARAGTSSTVALTPASIVSLQSYGSMTFTGNPVLTTAADTGGAPTGATGDTNIMMLQEGEIWEQFILGAGQTIIAPRMSSTGLLISLDLTDTEGAEYNPGPRNNTKYSFTIGTTAAFFFEATLNAADVSGCDPLLIGFRKVEANNATFTDYTDYASIGLSASDGANIWLKTELNSGGTTSTDTTTAWTDGQSKTLKVLVSAAGVVTYTINGSAPTVTAAFTFDNGDVVIPFIRLTHAAVAPGAINWISFKCGLQ